MSSGQKYQILWHIFAGCASQKTQGHARIARVLHEILTCFAVILAYQCASRAILACPCVFDWCNMQKSVMATQIIYLGPLPNLQCDFLINAANHSLI